jgi:hypothetical protein
VNGARVPEWSELMHHKRPLMPVERLLVQCVAVVSTHPRYQDLTPEQVYDAMREQAAQVLLSRATTREQIAEATALVKPEALA